MDVIHLIARWFAGLGAGALFYLLTTGPIFLLEILLPRSRPTLEARLRGVTIVLVVTPLCGVAVAAALSPIHYRPLIPTSVWAGHPIIAVICGLLIWDFCFYVMHRVQHKYLWRLHVVHHSIENVGAANNYNHPLQLALDQLMVYVPIALLGLGPGTIVSLIAVVQGVYIHSATRIHFRPLRWLLNDNQFHRIHHSRAAAHRDKNFSLFFPFWDLVFGTAHMHEPDAWPETGVEGEPEEKTVIGYLLQPFRRPHANRSHEPAHSTS